MAPNRTLWATLAILALAAPAARADTWYVYSGAPAGGDGTSWATAFRTVQQAINAADPLWTVCLAPRDTIRVKQGTYNLASTVNVNKVVIIYGGFPASVANPAWSDRNPAAYPTILDGGSARRCMNVTAYCVIDGFVFRNGLSSDAGGALYVDQEPYECLPSDLAVTVRNCSFLHNASTVSVGGAIYDLNADLRIEMCDFEHNSATIGGAIALGQSSPTISRCRFRWNDASSPSRAGGAIYFPYLCDGQITNCLFQENTAQGHGGAISCYQSAPYILHCTFVANQAGLSGFTGRGGAIHTAVADPYVRNSILWDNLPNQIETSLTSGAWVYHSDIEGGFAGRGGSNINLNPLFASPGDFHLSAGSPCIDTALAGVAPDEDLEGTARPIDGDANGSALPDMGAYEYSFVDLVIDSVTLDPARPAPGEPMNIRIAVRNRGSKAPANGFYVDWYPNRATAPGIGDLGPKFAWLDPIAPAATHHVMLSYTWPTVGLCQSWAQVDTTGQIPEGVETNNISGPQDVLVMLCRSNLDNTGPVDLADWARFQRAWLTTPADPAWDPLAELHFPADNLIDLRDLAFFADQWLCTEF